MRATFSGTQTVTDRSGCTLIGNGELETLTVRLTGASFASELLGERCGRDKKANKKADVQCHWCVKVLCIGQLYTGHILVHVDWSSIAIAACNHPYSVILMQD